MSALVVQKFGGTSVADTERMRAVADHIVRTVNGGSQVVAVVSAMGKMTDDLIRQASEVSTTRPSREMDMLLTAGERISTALLCMALADRGVPAVSLTGSQAGIITDQVHGKAKIQEIRADRVQEAVDSGAVPVVAGFQGVSDSRDITTLGRGGSDTTAVALAAALHATSCEIYTDVSGVFTADPRIEPNARRLSRVLFDEMLEIAATGGRVLSLRAVEFAKNHGVDLHVRSSFTWEPGTMIIEEDQTMEQPVVSAVTHDDGEVKVTISGVTDQPGVAAKLFRTLAERSVNVDMIVQNVSTEGVTDISFTVPADDMIQAIEGCKAVQSQIGGSQVTTDEEIGRVSLVGAGMKSHPGVAATMFETLANENVNIEMISTSSIRVSCVIRKEDTQRAVRALHDAFKLDAVPVGQ